MSFLPFFEWRGHNNVNNNSGVSDVDSSFFETGHIHCYKKGFQSTTGNGIANSVEPVEMAQ